MFTKALKAGKSLVLQTSEIEQKVLDATSNEHWGPTGTQMKDIARATHSYNDFAIIMNCIWKRLNDRGKLWRHVYKSLLLLEYLVKNGSDQCVREARVHIIEVQTLQQFQHIDEKDHDVGLSVRERAKQICDLLNDENKIRAERDKAQKVADKFNTFMSSEGGGYAPRSNYSGSSNSSSNYGGSGGGGGYGNNTSPREGAGRTYTAPANAVKGSAADDDDDLPVPQPLPMGSSPPSHYQHQPSTYGQQPTSPYQQQPTGYGQQQTQQQGSFYQQAPQQQQQAAAQPPNQAQIFSLLMDQPAQTQNRPVTVSNPPAPTNAFYQPQTTGNNAAAPNPWGQPVQQQPQQPAQLTGAGQYRPQQQQTTQPQFQQQQSFAAQWGQPQPVQQQEDFFNPRTNAAAAPAPVLTPQNTSAVGTEWADFAGYSGQQGGGAQHQQHQQQQPAGPADPWSAGSKLYNLDLDKKNAGGGAQGMTSSPQAPTLGALKQQHQPYGVSTPSSPPSMYAPAPTTTAAPSTAPIYVAGAGGAPAAYVLTPGPGGAYVLAPAPVGYGGAAAPAANPFGQPIRP